MAKKPHIAMILPDRIEHPVGGMGIQAKYLIEYLQKKFDFSVHGFPDTTDLPYYHSVSNPIPKIQHGGLNTLTGQSAYLASIMKMKESGIQPDLIHALDYTTYLAGSYASKILTIPLVVSMQLSAHLMHEANLFSAREPASPDGSAIENSMREIELLGLRDAHHIIQVSNMYKKIYSQIPGLDQKSTYIPNGVNLEEFATFEKINLPGTALRKIVYLGRFAPQKNIISLLQAYVPQNIDLIFVGEMGTNPYLDDMLIHIMKNKKNIHYLGPVYGQQKINILRTADAVIIPSLHECHPIVMHEAMAAGCLLLHSRAGDMEEILTPDFTIPTGKTPASITFGLEQFSKMTNEDLTYRQTKGLEVVKNYTWGKTAKMTGEIYLNVLKNYQK